MPIKREVEIVPECQGSQVLTSVFPWAPRSSRAYRQADLHRLLLIGMAFLLAVPAVAKMYEQPRSFSLKDKSLEQVAVKTLPKVDTQRLLEEDRAQAKNPQTPQRPRPYRFAVAIDTNFTLENSGTWQILPDGRLWRLVIKSPGATSLSLGLTHFDMPEGVKLWIYDPARTHVEGPYTARNRSHAGRLWTPIIEGDGIVVEVYVPAGVAQPVIEIGKVNHGYRGLATGDKSGLFGGSEGSCENDVVCPEGNPWRDQIRSAGLYTIEGTEACTGQLLNDVPVDFKPLVLSANHCGVSTSNDDTVVVFWNFQSPTCGTHTAGSLTENQTGATFRASSATSDFLLFELSQKPDPSFNVFYGGWDATGTTPPAAVCIHHPNTDVKAISFSNSAAVATNPSSSLLSDTPDVNGTHWRANWNSGVTEPGSSGSCLWNTANQRCIGQLHGGPSACGVSGSDLHDYFGRLSVSWEGGGTSSTRLRDWLDPGNTGTLGMDGAQPPLSGPVMRIEQTTLDYGQVELGFSFIKAIVIHNDGDAPLSISVADASPPSPDLPQWPSRGTATNASIASLGMLVLQEKFVPTSLGSFQISMAVTSSDPAQPSATILLKGAGISPIPIDSALVLDRSGSMSETAGDRTKIDALGAAVDLYANLLRPNTGGTGDRIALIKYNSAAQVYVPFDFADTNLPQINTKTDAPALADPNGLLPQGSTSIGGGMQTGAAQLPLPASAARKHVMVVLTDGIENTPPLIDSVLPSIHANDPALRIYSVGLGTDIDPSKLQEITNVTNGYHQVSDDLSGPSLFDLETFYFKIFANATDSQIALDPTVPVTVAGSSPIMVERARITSSDHRATFLVLNLPAEEKSYTLQLLDPNGNIIGPGSSVGGVAVKVVHRDTFTIYNVVFPGTLPPAAYAGDWVLRLLPKGAPVIGSVTTPHLSNVSFGAPRPMPQIFSPAAVVQVGFAALVGSDYRLGVDLLSPSYLPGSLVSIVASLSDSGVPQLKGRVTAMITAPDHTSSTILLYDDGSHGDTVAGDGKYTGQFASLSRCGTYRVFVRAIGHNLRGELILREETRYISLVSPACQPNPCLRACAQCCPKCLGQIVGQNPPPVRGKENRPTGRIPKKK